MRLPLLLLLEDKPCRFKEMFIKLSVSMCIERFRVGGRYLWSLYFWCTGGTEFEVWLLIFVSTK